MTGDVYNSHPLANARVEQDDFIGTVHVGLEIREVDKDIDLKIHTPVTAPKIGELGVAGASSEDMAQLPEFSAVYSGRLAIAA